MRRVRLMLAMVALFAVAACSEDSTVVGPQPGAGTLVLRLTTPHADDGAILFEVSGPPIDSALAVNTSLQLFTRRNGSTLAGALVGAVANGIVVTLRVPDVSAVAGYTARVLEV